MKTNIKSLELIEKGMTAKTVSKLTESQVNILHSRLIAEATDTVTKQRTYSSGEVQAMKEKGQPMPGGKEVKVNTDGSISVTTEGEMDEDVEVTTDPNKETETQDPKQVGPSSDDGFGNFNDGDMSEGKSTASSICHSQVGPKKSRKWERCVREVKKQLGEGKNPVSLFLEAQIMNIVERNLQPRITKRDLVKYLSEGDNFATKHLQSWGNTKPAKVKTEVGEQAPSTAPSKPKTSPTTKPGKPGTKPQRPPSPFKNPNPGEKESPKAKKVSPEKAKDEVIDVIMQLLQK